MRNFREYEVWKRAISFTRSIYLMTSEIPKIEQYGIIQQIQRASVSIFSNIAEGCSRSSQKDFARFIEIAQGPSFETENLLILCSEIGYIDANILDNLLAELQIIQKQLSSLYGKLMLAKRQQPTANSQ